MGFDDADTKFGSSIRPNVMVPGWEAQYRFGPIPGLGAFGRPEGLVVTDRRTIRAVDPVRQNGYYRGDLARIDTQKERFFRPQNQEIFVPDVRRERHYDNVVATRKMEGTMVVPDVREERRTDLSGHRLGQPRIEQLSDSEILDVIRLYTLQNVLFIGMDRASSLLASKLVDGRVLTEAAKEINNPEFTRASESIFNALIVMRSNLPKFKVQSRERFEAADEVAKIAASRGYLVKWWGLTVNVNYPDGILTDVERGSGREVDLKSLVRNSFEQNSADFKSTLDRVKMSLRRIGVSESELGIPPLIVILILGVGALIVGGLVAWSAVGAGKDVVKYGIDRLAESPEKFKNITDAFADAARAAGSAAQEAAGGVGLGVTVVLGSLGAAASIGILYWLLK